METVSVVGVSCGAWWVLRGFVVVQSVQEILAGICGDGSSGYVDRNDCCFMVHHWMLVVCATCSVGTMLQFDFFLNA